MLAPGGPLRGKFLLGKVWVHVGKKGGARGGEGKGGPGRTTPPATPQHLGVHRAWSAWSPYGARMGPSFLGHHQGFTGDTPTYFYCVDCKLGGRCPHLGVYTSVKGQVTLREGAPRFFFGNVFLGILERPL